MDADALTVRRVPFACASGELSRLAELVHAAFPPARLLVVPSDAPSSRALGGVSCSDICIVPADDAEQSAPPGYSARVAVEAFNYMLVELRRLRSAARCQQLGLPEPAPPSSYDHAETRDGGVGMDKLSSFLDWGRRKPYEEPSTAASYARISRAIECIDRAVKEFGWPALAFSYNGGKDCSVLLQLLYYVRFYRGGYNHQDSSNMKTVYILPAKPFAEVETFVKYNAKRYRMDITELPSPMQSGLQKYLADNPDIKAIFVGTRRTDPHASNLTEFAPTDAGWPAFMRVNPLLDWSYKDIWDYLREYEVPYCELYDNGYTSLGGVDNTLPNPHLREPDSISSYRQAYHLQDTDGQLERAGRLTFKSN